MRCKKGSIVLKFEPMILHVQCATLKDAQKLHAASLASGFKNTGLTIANSGNITLAIRSTHMLEVPLSKAGDVLVSDEYVKFVVEEANKKMYENQKRIERLSSNIQVMLNKKHVDASKQSSRKLQQTYNNDGVKKQVETEEHRLEHDCTYNNDGVKNQVETEEHRLEHDCTYNNDGVKNQVETEEHDCCLSSEEIVASVFSMFD
ncbi:tRNA wybutosine-synthesizing protein 3 homolog [Limulus polyphemus]|uniref:tRNA wybutosine-synthesizing protein 3 homolog n=1 Tax=Limulus polyphemus TaxID=6850 RepID=A0ABM1T786_LIMPO|nr:tRNA wybutosine-synthesizing protein 3 homolog [Limulus polyphemus]XP_022251743.1 tRNA wybutosine-synthesizing protein 3 homolog [Limulus polyphemus]XP_022251744.1 tRNA wybutosine-synthesizing protein 3 homolog [Limulus polyphemus]